MFDNATKFILCIVLLNSQPNIINCGITLQKACYLAHNPQKEESLENEKGAYMLPDGSTIEIGKARFRAPEVLFRPDLIGEECSGLHEVINAIQFT